MRIRQPESVHSGLLPGLSFLRLFWLTKSTARLLKLRPLYWRQWKSQVTVAGQSRPLEAPFFVLATQNPIELEGTYPLPEAQLDRFLLNPVIQYLSEADEVEMVGETTGLDRESPEPILSGEEIESLQALTRQVPAPQQVISYAVRLVAASRPESNSCDEWLKARVKWGAGSRGSQALVLASKAKALLDGRPNASREDVRSLAKSALRHRILPSFLAESEGISADDLIDFLLEKSFGLII